MKNVFLFIVFLLFTFAGNAQKVITVVNQHNLGNEQVEEKSLTPNNTISKEIMLNHTRLAQIQLTEFAANNIKYPKATETSGIESQIIVDVWINRTGKIINTKIIQNNNEHLEATVTKALESFELSWPQNTLYLGARRLRLPIDFIME